MIKPTPPSRPPGQYVVARGTQFRLVANEYDKNTYAQCSYVSHRTLMRCKQIRPKEELVKNAGKCEEHDKFCEMLRTSRNKEMLRIRAECDNVNSKKRRFNTFVVTNDYISDDEDFVQSISEAPSQLPDKIYENTIDSDPLRHAGVFTEKDILRRRLAYTRKDIIDISDFNEMIEAVAIKICDKEMDNNSKSIIIDTAQLRTYEAIQDCDRKDIIKPWQNRRPSEVPLHYCKYRNDIPDSEIIRQILENLLDQTDGKTPVEFIGPCENQTLLKADYCIEHIFLDKKQFLFTSCTVCGDPAVATDDPTCAFHRKEIVRYRCMDPQFNVRPGEEDVRPRPTGNELPDFQKNSQLMVPKRIIIDDSDDDESDTRLANLGLIENMASPLTALGMGFGPPRRTAPPYVTTGAVQRTIQQRLSAQKEEQLNKMKEEEEIQSQNCARERPFSPDNFNKVETSRPASARSSISAHHPTPRLLSSSTQRPGYLSALQQKTQIPVQPHVQYHRYPSSQQLLPTKYPLPSGQRKVSQPVAIPLERQRGFEARDPRASKPRREEEEELVEDRKTPPSKEHFEPIHYKRTEKNVPRGIPYVKHGSSFRRSDGTEIPSSQQPIAPHRLQMAPHREIALGIKPTSMPRHQRVESSALGTSSLPRPSTSSLPKPPTPSFPKPPTSSVPRLLTAKERQVFQTSKYEIAKDAPPVVAGADPKMDVKSYLQKIGAAKEIEDRVFAISHAQKLELEEAEKERIMTGAKASTSSPAKPHPTIIQKVQLVKSPAKSKINESPLGRPPKLSTSPSKKVKLAPQPGSSLESEPAIVGKPIDEPQKEVVAKAVQLETSTPKKMPIPQPLSKESPLKVPVERKRKATTSEEPEAKRRMQKESPKKETPTRTPRAAAIAANQAMNTKSSPKTPTSSSQPKPGQPDTAFLDPLSVLAAVSEIERVREEKDRSSKSSSVSPKSGASKSSDKTPRSTPNPTPRRSSRTQKTDDEQE